MKKTFKFNELPQPKGRGIGLVSTASRQVKPVHSQAFAKCANLLAHLAPCRRANQIFVIILALSLTAMCFLSYYKAQYVYNDNSSCYMVIIIDDFGYGGEGTEEMLSLPIPITAAVMPGLSKSQLDAVKAYKRQRRNPSHAYGTQKRQSLVVRA